jgi:hypothetical protein
VTKWSLAVDQVYGPNTGDGGRAQSTCAGLVTVHDKDGQSGQVGYKVEYYTTGRGGGFFGYTLPEHTTATFVWRPRT